MLQIIKQPADLVLSRNAVLYQLRATTIAGVGFGATGIRSDMIFSENYFNNGDTVAVRWTEPSGLQGRVTFTFSANANDSASYLPTNPHNTFFEYCQAIAAKMAAHPRLSPFFTVAAGDDNPYYTISITAKSAADGWAIDLSESVFAFPISYGNTPRVADRRPANHKILYDVFFESAYRSNRFELIAQNETHVNTEGYCTFDIKDTLDAAFTTSLSDIPIPNFNNTTAHIADNLRRYYVRIAERFGTPATVQHVQYIGTADAPNLVRLSGIADNLWLDNPNFLVDFNAKNRVLSWQPLEKTVTRFQPEWLAFQAASDGERVKIQYDTVLVDGTMTTDIATNIVELRYGETVLLPVNIYALGSTVAENVVRYYVSLLDENDNRVSETFTYTIDPMHHESQRYLMYLDGFGVPQTVAMSGVFSPSVDIDRIEANQAYAPNGRLARSGSFSSRNNLTYSFIYRSGHFQPHEIAAFVELVESEHVFEVFEEGFIPLRITEKRVKLSETGDFTEGLTVTASPRINYRNFSNALRFNLTQPSVNDWKSEDFDRNNRLAFGLKWA